MLRVVGIMTGEDALSHHHERIIGFVYSKVEHSVATLPNRLYESVSGKPIFFWHSTSHNWRGAVRFHGFKKLFNDNIDGDRLLDSNCMTAKRYSFEFGPTY